MTALLKYDAACRAVAEAKTFDEVREWEDKAAAVREYSRRARNREMELDALEIRERARRRRGELLPAEMKARGRAAARAKRKHPRPIWFFARGSGCRRSRTSRRMSPRATRKSRRFPATASSA